MTKKTNAFLSRHEQLRYDYLSKNSYYLGDKEKRELAYLQAKANGEVPDSMEEETVASYQGLSRRDRHQESVVDALPKLPKVEKLPKKKKKKKSVGSGSTVTRLKRWLMWGGVAILVLLMAMVGMFFKGLSSVTSDNSTLKPAITEVFNGKATRDGVNILILGSDKRITEETTEARTDTIMVMNVNNSSGKVKLVSFMRDTLVNIDGVSESDLPDNKLNTAFTIGEQENNQGAELVRQILKANFDLDIQYYVMIDFETFALAVDTLFPDGVEMDAQFATVDGEEVESVEVPDDLGMAAGGPMYQTITVGQQRMDGKTLLNYARFRGDDQGDNGRTHRQQEVMQAVISQLKDPTKLFTGSEALGKVYGLTSTNISFPFILSNGLSSLTDSQNGIERMTVPEQGDWVDEYDMYGGVGLLIDFEAYKQRLADLGLR